MTRLYNSNIGEHQEGRKACSEPVCYVVNNIAAGNRIHFLHSSMVAYGERWG